MGVGAAPVFSFFAVCAPHGFREAESLGKYGPRAPAMEAPRLYAGLFEFKKGEKKA